jgi:hypothetical protein
MEGGMEHKAVALKERTKSFALPILIIKLIRALSPGPESRIEADQSAFWLELLSDARLIPEARVKDGKQLICFTTKISEPHHEPQPDEVSNQQSKNQPSTIKEGMRSCPKPPPPGPTTTVF